MGPLLLFLSLTLPEKGYWQGPGLYEQLGNPLSPVSSSSPCSSIEIHLSYLEPRLTVERYSAQCGNLAPDWGPRVFYLLNSKVYNDEGDEIGTYSDTQILTQEPRGSVIYDLNFLSHPDGSLDTVYGVKNMVGTLRITGHLKNVNTSPSPPGF